MQHPTKVFDEWATLGKDKGMEISHAASVSEILDYALSRVKTESNYFSFLVKIKTCKDYLIFDIS